ncbi:MAG: rod shape-determining protein RodA [Gammaproteobacteria bacterium]
MDSQRSLLFRLHIDPQLFGGALILCGLGLVVLYSAGDQSVDVVTRQAIRMAIGIVAMILVAQISPAQLARSAPLLYVIGTSLLIAVFLFGSGRGAQRWLHLGLVQFQPSEIMKIAVPVTVAWYLYDKVLPPNLRTTIFALLLVLFPGILIIQQPDLGTALLVMAAGLFALFFGGVSWRWMISAAGIGLLAAPLAWILLRDYQRERILTLFDPQQDPLGAGYHIIQATIAVGSGGISGKGWLNGTQSHLEFLPERATDFIFAVYCEEFGFIGVIVMLAAYALILARGLRIALYAQDSFGRLLAASLTMTLFIYVFVNMGMVTGQLPVVGIPLPLVSYGGTSLVTILAGLGILMSIHTHKRFIVET